MRAFSERGDNSDLQLERPTETDQHIITDQGTNRSWQLVTGWVRGGGPTGPESRSNAGIICRGMGNCNGFHVCRDRQNRIFPR